MIPRERAIRIDSTKSSTVYVDLEEMVKHYPDTWQECVDHCEAHEGGYRPEDTVAYFLYVLLFRDGDPDDIHQQGVIEVMDNGHEDPDWPAKVYEPATLTRLKEVHSITRSPRASRKLET